MTRSVNKAIIFGRLGADPISVNTQAGSTITNFSVATTYSYKNKVTGQRIEETEWHKCVAFSRSAEIIRDLCSKGSQIYIEGRLKTNEWTDKNNVARNEKEIIVDAFVIPGNSKPRGEVNGNVASQDNDFDDDIPF